MIEENIEKKTEIIKEEQAIDRILDEKGRKIFPPGVSGNPAGRPPDTPEQKIMKKAIKEIVSDYKEKLAECLPEISPVLIAEAMSGNIVAIKEIHDRVMGKPPQDLNLGNSDSLPFQIEIKKKDES